MITRICCLAALSVLTGCSVAPQRVEIPVHAACLGEAPAEPTYRFGVGPKPAPDEAVRMLMQDFIDAKRYILDLKIQMSGCS